MGETNVEKPKASLEAAATTAADAADAAPVVIASTAPERELSDEDLDKVSGGANSGGGETPRVRPQVRAL